MKIVMILLCFLTASLAEAQTNSVYLIQFNGIDQHTIDMSSYSGKKIIVAVCDAEIPNRSQLLYLDSLYRTNQSRVAVIVVPADDFSAVVNEQNTRSVLLDSLHVSFLVSQTGKVKKSSGAVQHVLMQWLTKKTGNGHYDTDVKTPGDLFVMNEKGVLYARLSGVPAGGLMNKILAQ